MKAALLQEGRVLARGIASSKKPVSSTPITIHDASLDNPATFVVWFGCCDGDGASSILAEILPVLLRRGGSNIIANVFVFLFLIILFVFFLFLFFVFLDEWHEWCGRNKNR